MGILYHGSLYSGIKKLEPQKSTHGTYVYATPYRELAMVFAKRCGDNLTYSLYRNSNKEPWQIVERIPNGFETMFNNEASIYTLSDSTFKYINTGFSEVVSEVEVDILNEEKIFNVLDTIKKLEKEGLFKLYVYPNKPIDMPVDDSDLLNREINRCQKNGKVLNKALFKRMIYLHPNMLDLINKHLIAGGADIFEKNDIVEIFEEYLVIQVLNPLQEQYIKSSFISISSIYPELVPQLEKKLALLKKSKVEKIEQIIEHISRTFPNIPKDIITQVKRDYINDQRCFSQIREDLKDEINKMISIKKTSSKEIATQNIKTSRI